MTHPGESRPLHTHPAPVAMSQAERQEWLTHLQGAIADCDDCGTQITCGPDQLLDFVLLAADHFERLGHHMRVRVVRS